MSVYKNFIIGILSASLASCGPKLMNLEPGEHYAALSSCNVYDEPQGRRIHCEYGDGSDTVTVNGELTRFSIVEGGFREIEYFTGKPVTMDGITIPAENGRLAREARKRHYATVEFLHKNEKGKE